jgi:hypothetical protein
MGLMLLCRDAPGPATSLVILGSKTWMAEVVDLSSDHTERQRKAAHHTPRWRTASSNPRDGDPECEVTCEVWDPVN